MSKNLISNKNSAVLHDVYGSGRVVTRIDNDPMVLVWFQGPVGPQWVSVRSLSQSFGEAR